MTKFGDKTVLHVHVQVHFLNLSIEADTVHFAIECISYAYVVSHIFIVKKLTLSTLSVYMVGDMPEFLIMHG